MIQLREFTRPRPKVMVVSHERSGTHFLMNSIGKCFDYISDPWVNFDGVTFPINFHSKEAVEDILKQFKGRHLAHILKSHHPYDFFEPIAPLLFDEFHVFYMYRDPRDVMVSLWKYLRKLKWPEGPKKDDVHEFIRTEPAGHMLRYQFNQERTMIHRWRHHIEGWMFGIEEKYRQHVTYVRYGDLCNNFESTIRSFAEVLGPPMRIERPDMTEAVIMPSTGGVGGHKNLLNKDDLALFQDVAGPTMAKLGFV